MLTDYERALIKRVINGEKPDGFRVLKTRIQKAKPILEGDIELINKFLEKV